MKPCCILGGLWLFAAGAGTALGHDGPEQVIAALTAAIERRGASPDLLYRRACEWRVLGELARAETDLSAAVEGDPTHFAAGLELARVRLARGRAEDAAESVRGAEPFAETNAEKAACLMVRGEAARVTGDLTGALKDCDAACRLVPGEAEWVLLRSRLQSELGRHEGRVRDLEASRKVNPSAAILVELIEARIDAGQHEAALSEVEAGLRASRWRASWLLRRARALIGSGRAIDAQADLRAAVEEFDMRLNPDQPDATLLVERGLALAMLGETGAAVSDLDAAREHGADAWTIRRLEVALGPLVRPD